jgi:pyruvate/2-oxoacid:ferredoxin oxidoreductase beta subunit
MKISELIKQLEELQQQNGDMEVVLSVTDHTDWTYNFDFPGFDVDNVYDEDGEFDDETDYCVCGVSI